jgi:hypothetical protein
MAIGKARQIIEALIAVRNYAFVRGNVESHGVSYLPRSIAMPHPTATLPPIFLGYLPKRLVPRPDWLACPDVELVASVSECISRAPPDRIDHWKHNYVGLYDTEALARAIIPEDKSTEYTIFAYHALPVVFHDGRPLEWNPWTNAETPPPELDGEFNEHLRFDIVGYTQGGFFECSPLSCNGVAKNVAVNRFCLVDDLEQAMSIAQKFSMPDSRVEPAWAYVVVDVRKRSTRP